MLDKQTVLNNAGLNWTVRKEEMKTFSGIIIPKQIAIVREDNNTILGTHGAGYEPYQNDELFELLTQIAQVKGLDVHSGGLFGNGEQVYIQLKSDDLDLGGDTVKGYISGFNSFDGKTSLGFGNTNVTVSCMNSFMLGYHQVKSKMRHSSSMRPRIEQFISQIDKLLIEEEQTFKDIKKLTHIGIEKTTQQEIIDSIFEIKPEDYIKGLSTRKLNQIDQFKKDWHTEIDQKGDNLWGAFSAVTRYTTHSKFRDINRSSQDKMFGKTGDLERKLFSHLTRTKLVGAHN